MKHSKLYGALSYVSILIIVPAIAGRKDPFVAFHLNQGLILLIANIIFGCLSFLPGLTVAGDLLNCAVLILALAGFISALHGKAKELPIIGKIHIL